MEIPKLILFLCCTYLCTASDHHQSHTIPIEHYETELQNLGQHVEIPETPVKIIKITKTVAVKVPVPYPVKVIEKVPYPVHVSKPYPVPVPQIVKVPQAIHHGHEALDIGRAGASQHQFGEGGYGGGSHQAQDSFSPEQSGDSGHSFVPSAESQSYYGGNGQNEHLSGIGDEQSYGGSDGAGNYYGDGGQGSLESKSYDQAINQYLSKFQQPHGSDGGSNGEYH